MREVICEVVSQVTKKNKEELSEWSEDKLGSQLHKYLFGRRFLIVMDDMWSIDAWENIQYLFPDNGNGSRILVTTRQSQLVSQWNTDYSLQMKFLDEDSSWDLFSKIVFGERNSCPDGLKEIGKIIVDSCRGLPLSIVVVGGILKRMEHTRGSWESIRNNLTSSVSSDSDKHCFRLLKLSYNHLPVYLKPCFLYIGMFEEDESIKVSKLINLWISEGFLKPMKDRCPITVAMNFLKDLIDRNLIMIHKIGSTGNIVSCKIHDLLRELCLEEGQRDGFHHVIGRLCPQGINRQCRRVVIPRNSSKNKVRKELKSIPHARSVFCEYGKVEQCRNFKLLRTLQAMKTGRFNSDRSQVNTLATQYVNLRHLSIRVGSMSSFFSSLHLFWNLHTLIFSGPIPTVPTQIWKMPQFRHIEFMGWCLLDSPSDKDDDFVIMKNLGILKGVMNFRFCEEVIARIPNIKKLRLRYDYIQGSGDNDFYCVSNIESLCNLKSLSVVCFFYSNMQSLSFPHSLKSLSIWMNGGHEWEAMLEMLEKIGSLPHLEKLQLSVEWLTKWNIVEDKFPKLKSLK